MQPQCHSSRDRSLTRSQIEPGPADEPPADIASPVAAEAWVLTTQAGSRLLDAVAEVRSIGPADVSRFRKLASPEAVSAAIRLFQGRRKAAAKFERGQQMWVDPVGIEQSTSELVAHHKAARCACPLVVDLCAGIGGDTLVLASRTDVLAVDLDPGMCRRIRYNAEVYNVAGRVLPVQARAENFAIPNGAWLHLDPDRRALRSQRARSLDDYAPGPAFWRTLPGRVAAGAIKLSPASDFSRHFPGSEYEVELISLRGECKEATAWFGELRSCQRRATRLPERATWTDCDNPTSELAAVSPLSHWIYDPDPSLLRAGLLDGFALVHGLGRVQDGVDYLTGESLVSTPFLTAFEVHDLFPLDVKRLRRMIANNCIGTLDIKVRGVDITPEALRARLAPQGDQAATLLVFGGQGPARAVLAQRASTGGSTSSSKTGAGGECGSA